MKDGKGRSGWENFVEESGNETEMMSDLDFSFFYSLSLLWTCCWIFFWESLARFLGLRIM